MELHMGDLHLSCILMLDYLSDAFANLDYTNGVFAKFAEDMAAKISEDIPHPIKMNWERPQGGCEFSPVIKLRLETPLA